MKKISLILVGLLLSVASFAQSSSDYLIVDLDKIYKSMTRYNNAITTLENLSKGYQSDIDKGFADLEALFQDYQKNKAYMSQTTRLTRENTILERETELTNKQKEVFDEGGILETRQKELFEPIEEMINIIITNYAKQNGYKLVLDKSANPSILYYSPEADKTAEIINMLNQ